MSNSVHMNISDRVLRPTQASKMLSVSRTTLWRLAGKNDFPKKIRIGSASTGWLESELRAWLETRKED